MNSNLIKAFWNSKSIRSRSSNLYRQASTKASRHFGSSGSRRTKRVAKEPLLDYTSARYCPIAPGHVINDRYTALAKLGYGGTSITWLCKDKSNAYKVLKIGSTNATSREKMILERLGPDASHPKHPHPQAHPGSSFVRWSERIFTFSRGGQEYNCFVFEPLGPSLLEFACQRSHRPFETQEVRLTARLLLYALDYLHTKGVVHTDIKLDNIQLLLPDEDDEFLDAFCAETPSSPSPPPPNANSGDAPAVASREMQQTEFTYPILCDLGSACFSNDPQMGVVKVQSLVHRAPEVMLGDKWDQKIDIWNFGVVVWKLISNMWLFGGGDEQHSLEHMIRYLGAPPKSFLDACRKTDGFFDESGAWRHGNIEAVRLEDFVEDEASAKHFFDFLRCALRWDPRERSSAAQLLGHKWLA